jgi:glycosyltransferase involved in cell wall biosynthesis
MKVWLFQIGETLPLDDRVRKLRTAILADKLRSRGHEVVWWASAFDHFKKDWVFTRDKVIHLNNGTKTIVLKGRRYKKNVSFARLIDHRVIARKFRKISKLHPLPDIVIAAMPSYDLSYEAIRFSKAKGIPIIVDIRDQWPDLFLDFLPRILKPFAKLALYKDFKMVKETFRDADALVSMMNVLLDWGLEYAERERTWKDRVFYLGYKRRTHFNNNSKEIKDLIAKLKNRFVVTFIGTFASFHNPYALVEAAKLLRNENISFVIAGTGELFDEIRKNALGLENVFFPGWIDDNEINTLLNYSHIGVCSTTKKASFFPNKAFLYMSAGLPIITSFEGDLKEIIEKNGTGFYYSPNDTESLRKFIEHLRNNEDLRKKMSLASKETFDNLFDADKIYEEYVDHIEAVYRNYRTYFVTTHRD